MTRHFFVHTLLTMLLITSCGSNKSAIKLEESLIKHIFVNDIVHCSNFPNKKLELQYLVVKHPNILTENRINSKLLSNDHLVSEKSYSEILKDINSDLENACSNNTLNEHETTFRYESIYNKNDVLGILQRVGRFQDVQFYFKTINLDLITGNEINSDEVFKTESMQGLVDICNSKILNTINELVTSVKENKESDDEEYVESILDIFDKKHDYEFTLDDLNNFVFIKNKDKLEGIKFIYSLDFPWTIKAHEPDFDLFFTSKELEPFVQHTLKKRLGW